MTKRMLSPLLVLCVVACGGRGEEPDPEPDVACTMEARSAFAVTVVDAVTSESLAPEATVRVTDGTYSATPEPFDSIYSGAHERAGTYTVIVSHPDYQQWQRLGVMVERDECHVITEPLEARLMRQP